MSVEMRKKVATAVREALAVLGRAWTVTPMGDGTDPDLDRVVAGQVLAAESHLWEARAALDRLTSPATEEVDE